MALEDPMAKTALTNELLDLETQYWQALKEKDVDTAMRLTDEECIITGAQGVDRINRRALSDMMKNAPYTLNAFELKEPEVSQLRDDVAILAYKVHEELTVDGKPVKLDAAEASTWVRRDGGWRCALHTESIAGDPFGRDRRANA
jgi:ketosteroid isomerase-like protein